MDYFIDRAQHTLVWIVAMGLVFGLLALAVKRARAFNDLKNARQEMATNLALGLLNGLIMGPIFIVNATPFFQSIDFSNSLGMFWQGINGFVVFVLAFLLAEFIVYWRHRFEHSAWLWRFHATHHADEHLHWLSVLRKHPVSGMISHVCDLLPLLFLGLSFEAIIASNLVRSIWGYFIHADVPWTLGMAGKWLMSPAAHRLHHIRDEALMGTNYGNTITLWDRLFGTYRDPSPYLGCDTGIAEGTRNFAEEIFRPWEDVYRRSKNRAEDSENVITVQSATRTKLSITRLVPLVSKSISSLLPSWARTSP